MLMPNATYVIQEQERGHAQQYDSGADEDGRAGMTGTPTRRDDSNGDSDIALLNLADA